MAKHGGFNGFPGGGGANLQQMMKQAQKLQQQMTDMSEQIENTEFEATSGGGMVKVTMLGNHEIKTLEINPQVVDPEDVDMLQDLIIAAVNEAIRKTNDAREASFSSLPGMGGLGGLGGLFG